jgi:hypothetical protein
MGVIHIFADPAARQFAIKPDVVDAAKHDHPRTGITDLRQLIETLENVVGSIVGLYQDDIRRRRIAVRFGRGCDAAHLDFHVSLRQTTVLAGRLHGGCCLDRLAEGLNRYPRRWRDVGFGGAVGRRHRHPDISGGGRL